MCIRWDNSGTYRDSTQHWEKGSNCSHHQHLCSKFDHQNIGFHQDMEHPVQTKQHISGTLVKLLY